MISFLILSSFSLISPVQTFAQCPSFGLVKHGLEGSGIHHMHGKELGFSPYDCP